MVKLQISIDWEKSEPEDLKDLIAQLQTFRRKHKNSMFIEQENKIRALEKSLKNVLTYF